MVPPYRPTSPQGSFNGFSPENSSTSSHEDPETETHSEEETGKEESEEEEQVPAGLVLRAFSRPTLAVSETGKCLSIALTLFYRCTSGRQVHASPSSDLSTSVF